MAVTHAGEERATQAVERAVAAAPVPDGAPAGRILALQRSAGNAAVARLAASRRSRLARAWGPTSTGTSLGPQHGGARPGGWNAQDTQVAGTTRIPVDDLPAGVRGDDDQRPTTRESAQRRAIVIVPNRVDVSAGSVEVLLHFHGLNIGYRERDDGTVRDVERDMIEQQLGHSGRNMIAILAQGEVAYGQGRFSIGNPQTYANAVLAKAVPHLPNPPASGTLTASHLVLSGHSGGGPNAVTYANQMQASGTEDEWAGSPPLLLFDAINGPGELGRLQTFLRDWLNNDSRWLQAAADPAALLRRRGLKLRSTYSNSDIYVRMNRELETWLNRWFASNVPAALSSVAADWRAQYRVERVGGGHDDTMATGRQAPRPTRADPTAGGRREEVPPGVDGRSEAAGVPTYSGGGNLENALNALPPNPIPPRERTPHLEPLLSRSRRLDRQDPDPDIPPPTPEERQRAGELLIAACDMKAQEHRINTAQVCLVETQDGTPGTAEITHLPASYVRARLADRASNAALNTAFDAAVARILGEGVRRSEMMMTRRAYEQVPTILRLLESQFIHDPNASSLDLLGPDRSRRYREDTPWGHEDYPGGTAGANEGRARAMAGELSGIRPERRANSGGDAVVDRGDMALPRMREYVESQLVEVPDLAGFRLNRHASEAFVRMRDAARADVDPATGHGVELAPAGGAGSFYRTPAASAASSQASGNAAAVASYSTHNLGLAVDLRMSFEGHNYRETTTRPMQNVVDMRQSPAHKFLFVRGARYGFYPYQNEPWHWEYNPPGFRELFMREYQAWLAGQGG